ncbi:hypothetical protein CHELA20_51077 [Hyphomicrobiales bacterium]|nr:hypothetical protein CHELA20_51077 [Hyphomicrobiales bacterium]CAH1674213.1 hypothetical protein CHELA41_23933 [Hyphomicrobiales bacterium]
MPDLLVTKGGGTIAATERGKSNMADGSGVIDPSRRRMMQGGAMLAAGTALLARGPFRAGRRTPSLADRAEATAGGQRRPGGSRRCRVRLSRYQRD